MNDLKILTLAIQRAMKRGYRYILDYDPENDKFYVQMLDLNRYYSIIFDHNFAKAFWGTGHLYRDDCDGASDPVDLGPAWKSHLSKMALSKEPLQYIRYYLGE